MTDNTDKLMAEALVECGYANGKGTTKRLDGEIVAYFLWWGDIDEEYDHQIVAPFIDTLQGRRQLDALFFYTLFPDKQAIISGDGHFDTREQMINHVNEYFKQLAEKS